MIQSPKVGESILPWALEVTTEANRPQTIPRAFQRRKAERLPKPRPFELYITAAEMTESEEPELASITVKVRFGNVYLSEDWSDVATIAGLTTTACELSAEDDSVWLQMTQTGEGAPTITLQHGAPWADFPQMWSYSIPYAAPNFVWYQMLGYLRAPRTGEAAMKIGGVELVLDQVVKTNLIRRTVCVESVTAHRIPQLHPWY